MFVTCSHLPNTDPARVSLASHVLVSWKAADMKLRAAVRTPGPSEANVARQRPEFIIPAANLIVVKIETSYIFTTILDFNVVTIGMCASVFQHIFTALALQLHCSSDKDNKYMLDIFSLQFVRLQLEMKSNIQSFSPFAYNLSSQTFTYQYIHPS